MRIALVGAGPGNLYAGINLSKLMQAKFDVFDALPAPFGLVRHGVAPDHQDVKNVTFKFNEFLKMPNVRYFGNVKLGKDLSLNDLRQSYNGVVLGYGTALSNSLNIDIPKGMHGLHSANEVVGWYNGHLDYADLDINLNCRDAIIVGNGNVALDIARILLKDPFCRQHSNSLANTDITTHALKSLSSSQIRNVYIVGRRSAMEAAFTTKELRDLTKMDIGICGDEDYLKNLINQNSERLKRDIPKKRLLDLLCKNMNTMPDSSKRIHFIFEKSPKRLTLDSNHRISGIVFENNLIKDGKAIGLNTFETINAGLAITAIGYKGERVDPTIPWDDKLSRIPHILGRISGSKGIIPALYVSGWLKTGPVGTIASTLMSSVETAHSIAQDKELLAKNVAITTIEDVLVKNGKKILSGKGWEKIDAYEVESGQKLGKVREKLVNIEDIYRISNNIVA